MFKKILFAFLILILTIGVVSATENLTGVVSIDDGLKSQDALSYENGFDEILEAQNTPENILEKAQTNADDSKSSPQSSGPSSEPKIIKTKVKTYDIDSNIYKKSKIFKIKITNKKTNKPIKNLKISLEITNNFHKYKTYTLKTNNKGIAKFNIKNLKMGYNSFDITSKDPKYLVEGFSGVAVGKLKKPVTVKVNSNIKLKNGDRLSTFYVKKYDGMFHKGFHVLGDEDNKHIIDIYKVKFYFKNNKNGKIITKTSNNYVKPIKGYSPVKAKIWYLESPMRTDVKEKSKLVQYKSAYKLQILLKGKPVKNVKVNFKVENGGKYKNYILKTDKKGFIKFNTKNLKLGYHKISVSSKNKNYDIYHKSKIFIGKLKKFKYLENDESLEFKNDDFIRASFVKSSGSKTKIKISSLRTDDYGNDLKAHSHFVIKAKIFFKNNKNNNLITTKIVKKDYSIKLNSIKGYTPFKVQVWYLQG